MDSTLVALAAQSVGETHRMTINCIYDQGAIFMVFLGSLSPHPTQNQKKQKQKENHPICKSLY